MADPSRARWLQEARDRLQEEHGPQPGPVVVTVRAPQTGAEIAYTCPPPLPQGNGRPLVALSPREREIVRAIGEGTLTAKQVAARLRCGCDAGLRAILANLCEREPPVLVSGHTGYRVSG